MSRPSRLDSPGTWHHVMNRGLAHRPIFEVRADVRYFLSRVAHAVRRGEIEVHAWCLMTTHFHLLAYSPRGDLDVALRRIQHESTRRFNRRRGRDGTLYRSRFTSRHIDSYAYRDLLIRYIDANPVDAKLVSDAPLHLDGSASWYARARGPAWMERAVIEGEVRRRARKEVYDPNDYACTYGAPLSQGAKRLIQLRMRRPVARGDPTDSLLANGPAHVKAWLIACARLADGMQPGVPLVDPTATLEFLARRRATKGEWEVRLGRGTVDAWGLLEAGLIRTLCNSTYVEIEQVTGLPRSTTSHRCRRHALALELDADYAREAAEITRELLTMTYAGSPPSRVSPC